MGLAGSGWFDPIKVGNANTISQEEAAHQRALGDGDRHKLGPTIPAAPVVDLDRSEYAPVSDGRSAGDSSGEE